MPPAKDKQRIENKHLDCLNDYADRDNGAVSHAEGISERHAGSPAERDSGGGYSNQNLGLLRRHEQLDGQPRRVCKSQRDTDQQHAPL